MLASRAHAHDPERLYRTGGVRGAGGRTRLMRAVARRDEARTAEILGACPTPATRAALLACVDDDGGRTALHLACDDDRFDEAVALRVVELLLANGADPLAPARGEGGHVWHATHYAARWSARLVQRLVAAGAPIDGGGGGDSTLCVAARAGTVQGVRMIPALVALGADVDDAADAMLELALHPVKGAQPTNAEVVAALKALESMGNYRVLEPDDDTGLMAVDWAAIAGNVPVVRAELSRGAVADNLLVHGAKHPELVRACLAAGAPVDGLIDSWQGEGLGADSWQAEGLGGDGPSCSALMAAAHFSVLESVEALLAAGASVDLRSESGATALMHSVAVGSGAAYDPRVTQALLAAGADVAARDKAGDTALHHLAGWSAQQPWAVGAARLLLQRGADARAVNKDDRLPSWCVPFDRGGPLHRLLIEAEEAAAAAEEEAAAA
jgi:ankyrin repeat protein